MRKFLCSLTLLLSTCAFAQNMFRGNLEHTGVYAGTGVRTLNGLKWKFKTGGPVISSPAVADGVLYVGSTDRHLYALSLADGSMKWKFETGSTVTSSPAVVGGVAYFLSYDSNFYAVDAATGALKWKFATGGEKRYSGTHLHHAQPAAETMPDPWDFFLSSPAVWNGIVYFGSSDGNIYALDAANGSLKWKVKTGDVVHSSPAVSDGIVYIGGWDTYLYALDAASGKEIWRFKTGDDPEVHNHVGIQSSPAVVDGIVYFGCRDAHLYALDAKSGKQLWAFTEKNGSWINNTPAIHEGKVYFGTSIPSFLHSVDAKTGAAGMTLDVKAPVFASIAIANGTAYFGAFNGKVTAVDLKTEKPLWTFQTDGSKENFPDISNADGTINFGAVLPRYFYDDMVVGVYRLLQAGTVLSSPVVVDDALYFGSGDGNVYALK